MWFFKKWLTKSKVPLEGTDDLGEMERLIHFLESQCGDERFSKALDDRLKDYHQARKESKAGLLPGLYLLFEQALIQLGKTSDRELPDFRKSISNKFARNIGIPEFRVIFQHESKQEYLLCSMLLKGVLEKAYQVLGTASDNYLEDTLGVVERKIEEVFDSPDDDLTDLREALTQESKELFQKLSDRLGERLVINFYRSVYGELSHNYRLLDAFPIILTLFPEKALDDQQISLLNRDQMKKLLKQQVSSLQNANQTLNNEIQERKQAQQQLEKSEVRVTSLNEQLEKQIDRLESANKELESFSYSVAHDLRAPLRAIDGFSKILLEDYKETLDDEGQRLLGIISGNVQKMGKLIDGLLTFSRLSRKSVEFKLINTKSIVDEVINTLQVNGKSLSVKDLPMVKGERDLIQQVFTSLISNAVKFTSREKEPKIEIGCTKKDGTFEFFVRDNGVGFDMNYYDKLFGVFQTLHSEDDLKGTGVGLAITQKIIEKHKGKIWAESNVGEGASFHFTMPQA